MTTFLLCTLFVLIPALLLFSAVIAFKRRMTGAKARKKLFASTSACSPL